MNPPLTTDEQRRAADVFKAVVELPPVARATHLVGLDDRVRHEVESLLSSAAQSAGYLQEPLAQPRRLASGSRLGVRRLDEVIGQGGMSIVHRAERVEGGYHQRAAIKLIALPALLPQALEREILGRFESERQISAKLEHANICRLYLVLEYVEGVDLVSYASGRPLPERVRLMADVARVVHFAHQRLLVHRDLKPANILVTAEGVIKLFDFGIAKPLDPSEWELPEQQTATLFRAATPPYASPEQLRGETVTTAADIYALGRVWNELAGAQGEEDLSAIAEKAVREEPDQKQQMDQQRQRAEIVAGFLRSLFRSTDPEQNQSNRLTTRELLDTMAEAYFGLGLHEKSNELYSETAPAYLRRGDRVRAAGAYGFLAEGQSQRAQYGLAVDSAQQAVTVARAGAPGDLAVALEHQCLALHQAGKITLALSACRDAANLFPRSVLPPIVQSKLTRSNGMTLADSNDHTAAEASYRDSLALARGIGQPSTTAESLEALGILFFRQGPFADSEAAIREALGLQRKLYPDGHAKLARTLNNLANTIASQKKFVEAEKIYREAHAMYAEYLGADSRELLVSVSKFAVMQQAAGDLKAAAETLLLLLEKQRKVSGLESLAYKRAVLKLASVRLEQSRYTEASQLAREAMAGLHQQQPPPKIERGYVRGIYAAAQVETARGREALYTARAGQELLTGVIKPSHWMSQFADAAIGVALASSGHRKKAQTILDPMQKLFENNKAGRWRAERVRRWRKRSYE